MGPDNSMQPATVPYQSSNQTYHQPNKFQQQPHPSAGSGAAFPLGYDCAAGPMSGQLPRPVGHPGSGSLSRTGPVTLATQHRVMPDLPCQRVKTNFIPRLQVTRVAGQPAEEESGGTASKLLGGLFGLFSNAGSSPVEAVAGADIAGQPGRRRASLSGLRR
ncbi:unnamed protein product [Protopolystoma xenopodis]|uniref:Uncharacterized protein n=1 Tax=Protopolystoma xenopodis TaxID=117903 RepID=A0A3S5CID9_9PLAT|nr:unnamed protein product [Protopolystoma xenopodis]